MIAMLNKSYLKEVVRNNFPDLENTRFIFNDTPVLTFTEQYLLPFLIYQNTVDLYHRIIGLFLPANSNTINLIPFYVMMGQYRKALNTVMQARSYQNLSFTSNEKQVVFKGDICNISSVDFINRQLKLRAGRGNETNVSFLESYNIQWSYRNALDIKEKIESFEIIDKAGKGNIFTLPLAPNSKQYEGVIIFTNTARFESLMKNVEVSGSDIRDYLNIEKVIFPSNEDTIKFARLSKTPTAQKPVSVLIARHDAFRAYDDILKAGNGRLNHIKTIIIDDFDELINRWEKTDSFQDEVTWLNHNYFQKVHDKKVKDLYLISRNSSLQIHDIFKKMEINYRPWLLQPLEELSINEKRTNNNPKIVVTNVRDFRFENLNNELSLLISKWKLLAQTSFCNGEILGPINFLYELRTKLNSFFDSKILKDLSEEFLNNLNQLQTNWFASGQDYGTIKETRGFLEEKFSDSSCFINFKLKLIIEELSTRSVKEPINIVSDNSSVEDVKWLTDSISKTFPKIKTTHYYKKDFYSIKQDNQTIPAIIFYLTSDKKLIGAASSNVLAEEQIFILNKRACSFTENYTRKYQCFQLEAGSASTKYELLNIKAPLNSHDSESSNLIEVLYNKREIDLKVEVQEEPVQDTDLQKLVEEVVQVHLNNNSSKEPSDKYILFFDDGTLTEVPESRHFFIYDDDKQSDDLEKALKAATKLEVGDQIIIPKRALQVKDLLTQALKKNPDFSHVLEMDEKWRILISNHIKRTGMEIDFFCRKLLQNGFKIGVAAVKNWIDGETRRPDNFKGLLQALSQLSIVSNEEIKAFDKSNSDLKSIQIRFVRTATRKLIAKLQGINLEEDEVFNDSLLNNFINHIEIKRISVIYKI